MQIQIFIIQRIPKAGTSPTPTPLSPPAHTRKLLTKARLFLICIIKTALNYYHTRNTVKLWRSHYLFIYSYYLRCHMSRLLWSLLTFLCSTLNVTVLFYVSADNRILDKHNTFIIENTLPESLIKVFPAWAYCQLWLSSTAIVIQNQQ